MDSLSKNAIILQNLQKEKRGILTQEREVKKSYLLEIIQIVWKTGVLHSHFVRWVWPQSQLMPMAKRLLPMVLALASTDTLGVEMYLTVDTTQALKWTGENLGHILAGCSSTAGGVLLDS